MFDHSHLTDKYFEIETFKKVQLNIKNAGQHGQSILSQKPSYLQINPRIYTYNLVY